MFLFERIPRRQFYSGMTPGWLLGVFLFSGAIIFSYFLSRSGIFRITTCPTLLLFELPCPFCGGSRSTFAWIQGDPLSAFRWNPLIAISVIAFPLWVAIWMVTGIRIRLNLSPPRFLAGFLLLLMLNWAYVVRTQTASSFGLRPVGIGNIEIPGADR